MNKKPLYLLFAISFFLLLINFVFIKFDLYSHIFWLDMLMHFMGGFLLALMSIYLLTAQMRKSRKGLGKISIVIIALLAALSIGCFWEVIEIAPHTIGIGTITDIEDTKSDIFFDLAGGLFGAIVSIQEKSWS